MDSTCEVIESRVQDGAHELDKGHGRIRGEADEDALFVPLNTRLTGLGFRV